MKTETFEVCDLCYAVTAYGEPGDLYGDDEVARSLEALEALSLAVAGKLLPFDAGDMVTDFDTRACDACGPASLAGGRHSISLLY